MTEVPLPLTVKLVVPGVASEDCEDPPHDVTAIKLAPSPNMRIIPQKALLPAARRRAKASNNPAMPPGNSQIPA